MRHLGDAGATPLAPHVEHEDLALGVGDGPRHTLERRTAHDRAGDAGTALDPLDRERYDAPGCDVDRRRRQGQGPRAQRVGPVVWPLRRRDAASATGVVTGVRLWRTGAVH